MIPIFKSHYSLGRSILTLEHPDSMIEGGPDSIVSLAKDNDLKEVFLVDHNMSGFLQAYKNLKDNDIKLIFGLRLNVCADMSEKSEEELQKTFKYMFLSKTTEGYKKLIKISTEASRNGFYYEPRIDFKTLKKYWNDKDLMLVVPFYDSFLFKNTLCNSICIPDFTFAKPTFLLEDNDLPFDKIVQDKVKEYTDKNNFDLEAAKSIFYAKEKDFKAYITFRCINNRTSLNKPNLDHMCSNKFSFETWQKKS